MRRFALALMGVWLAFAPSLAEKSWAEEPQGQSPWSHALSLVGQPKYAPDFKHFDYVNVDAPKTGVVRLGVPGGFDNFNPVIAEVKGNLVAGLDTVYETLMTQSEDEISTEYGLLAEAVQHPPDYSSVTYRLNAAARWHDGEPVTPEDVIFSFENWKRLSPLRNKYYGNVVKAEKTAEREITFTFDVKNNRELPQILGQLLILPKHWWEGTRADGTKRSIEDVSKETPLGSGPYRMKANVGGRSVSYERVKDYWGANLPTRIGTQNFDEKRFEYFRDPAALFEGFKADEYDFRFENSARNWMTQYDFPGASTGKIVKEEFPILDYGVMQAFVINTRREKFKDVRVRKALNLAFNFEQANKDVFFGLYKRIDSYFYGTELAAAGLPAGKELAVLESLKDKLPPEIFTTPFANPVNNNDAEVRANLREALKLLTEAGWELKSGKLSSKKTGEAFTIEFLFPTSVASLVERFALPYKASLERLGFVVAMRSVDDVQYENLQRSFDYDILALESWAQTLSPGNEQRDYWGSAASEKNGTRNYIGVKDEAVDALIEKIIFATNREELVAATRALDRVLLAGHYVVPQWGSGLTRTARWDRFGHPSLMPKYGRGSFPTVWWHDEEKAKKVAAP
jgi:microcin C transport system substrate-binding protein